MSYVAIPAYGDGGYEIPPARNRVPAPAPGREHQWIAQAVYTISQAAVERAAAAWMRGGVPGPDEGITLDHENLQSVIGPVCLKCTQPLNQTTYARPCPVNVTYLPGTYHHN